MATTSDLDVSFKMGKKRSIVGWIVVAAVAIVGLAIALYGIFHRRPLSLRGAVTVQDSDPRKELPIADVEITAANGSKTVTAKSDATGFFRVTLPIALRRGHAIILQFRH